MPLPPTFFERDPVAVARDLVACTLLVDGCGGRIVEVEAYRGDDAASHSFGGPTARNRSMFGPAGCAYVYRSYGIHWLLNVVCGGEGTGAAVLIRAVVPERGRASIAARRPGVTERDWCRGPGRVGSALAIGPQHDGLRLDEHPFQIEAAGDAPPVSTTRRIGISRDVERPWRFVEAGSRWVSSPAAGPSDARSGG